MTVRIGTRASAARPHPVRAGRRRCCAPPGREVELVDVRTEGDVTSAPLATIGGTGVFVSALRDALLRGEVDVAVHSLKDLPDRAGRRHRAGRGPVRARTRATSSWPATG